MGQIGVFQLEEDIGAEFGSGFQRSRPQMRPQAMPGKHNVTEVDTVRHGLQAETRGPTTRHRPFNNRER